MNDVDRRYDEDEVTRILELATREERGRVRRAADGGDSPHGLTLREIQEIAREVGIAPERIAEGARALVVGSAPVEVRRRLLGFPLGVGGAAGLSRPLTDTEWERLVGEVRIHFNAHGKLERSGSLRSWRNGNLRVLLEPTEGGQRIHIQTHRAQSEVFVRLGGTLVGIASVLTVVGVMRGGADADLGTIAMVGGGFVIAGLAPLRAWARRRRAQMEEILESAVRMASRTLPGSGKTEAG